MNATHKRCPLSPTKEWDSIYSGDLDTQNHIFQAHILNVKLWVQYIFDRSDNFIVTTYHVINIKTQIDIPFFCVLDIYIFVTFVIHEATRQYNIVKLLILFFLRLLETIQKSKKPILSLIVQMQKNSKVVTCRFLHLNLCLGKLS